MGRARELAKRIAFRIGLGAPRYPYPNVEPASLALLVNEIDRLAGVEGSILEIGVARGMTTRFMVEHIKRQGYDDHIYALDTFNSFTAADLEHEVRHRGKALQELRGFEYNDLAVWRRNFAGMPVTAIQSDAGRFDYSSVAPIKLAFVDVDLYVPTYAALPRIYKCLVPGGTIAVDDCITPAPYDGAHQAYKQFCSSLGITPYYVGKKCGVIRKPV